MALSAYDPLLGVPIHRPMVTGITTSRPSTCSRAFSRSLPRVSPNHHAAPHPERGIYDEYAVFLTFWQESRKFECEGTGACPGCPGCVLSLSKNPLTCSPYGSLLYAPHIRDLIAAALPAGEFYPPLAAADLFRIALDPASPRDHVLACADRIGMDAALFKVVTRDYEVALATSPPPDRVLALFESYVDRVLEAPTRTILAFSCAALASAAVTSISRTEQTRAAFEEACATLWKVMARVVGALERRAVFSPIAIVWDALDVADVARCVPTSCLTLFLESCSCACSAALYVALRTLPVLAPTWDRDCGMTPVVIASGYLISTLEYNMPSTFDFLDAAMRTAACLVNVSIQRQVPRSSGAVPFLAYDAVADWSAWAGQGLRNAEAIAAT